MAGTSLITTANVPIVVTVQVEKATRDFEQFRSRMGAAFDFLRQRAEGLNTHFTTMDRILGFMAIGSIGVLVEKFARLSAELQNSAALMVTLEGSVDAANQQLDRLITLSGKTPLGLKELTEGYIRLKTAGIEPISDDSGNGALRNVADAVAAFGGTSQEFKRAIIGMQQVAGKGVASMEEFRQQIGEAMPTALKILAEQMHMTMSQLVYDMSKGNIDGNEALTKMIEGFEIHYHGLGEAIRNSTLAGAAQSIIVEFDKLVIALNRIGALDPIVAMMRMVADGIEHIVKALNGAGVAEKFAAAMQDVYNVISANKEKIAEFIQIFQNVGAIIGNVLGMIINIAANAPPELLAGGLITLLTFGKVPLMIGVLLATFSGQIATFLSGVSAIVKAMPSQVLIYGMIGWILFGRWGALIGALAGIGEAIFNFLDGLFRYIYDVGGKAILTIGNMAHGMDFGSAFADATIKVQTWDKALDSARQKTKAFSLTNMGMNTSSDTKGIDAALDSFKAHMQGIKDAQAQLAAARKEIEVPQGLNTAQIKQYTKDLEDLRRVEEKLAGITQGPGARTRLEYKPALENMAKMKAQLEKEAEAFSAKGDQRGAAEKKQAAADVGKSYDELRTKVEKLAGAEDARVSDRASAKAARAAAKLAREMQSEKDRIANFQADITKYSQVLDLAYVEVFGGNETDVAVEKAKTKYAGLQDQLAKMVTSVGKLHLNDKDELKLLSDLAILQEQLNKVKERGIELAKKKVQWELQDAQIQRDRDVNDMRFDLQTKNDTRTIDPQMGRRQDLANVMQDWTKKTEEITDKITAAQRFLEEHANSEQAAGIQSQIANLETLQAAYDQYYSYRMSKEYEVNQAVQGLYNDTANAVSNTLTQGFQDLANGTFNAKKLMLQMYAEITAAAARYIVKLIMIKLLEMAANFMMPGAGTGMSAATTAIANGATFNNGQMSKFAMGGAFTNKIVSGPTLFPVGIMGEAGEEGILPLTRIGGKLGVHAAGMSNKGGDMYHIEIHALDAKSVRELMMMHADALVPAFVSQSRLNNRLGRTN